MKTNMKSVIVGTAGHIDHGKSSLVRALTGMDPDRLPEEKRRGITIDLGFAFLEEGGVRFGFVDVPGHEKFVSNMLAGAAGIDLLLLVIAADESIKPQTREHFDICRLLEITSGIVALTKSDLVDAETLELARLDVEEFLQGSFLQGAPVLAVSTRTGQGLAELKAALVAATEQTVAKDATKYLRLPVDRSFAMKGFGTVVTGTLVSGSLGVGDEVELFPAGLRLRVRGIHSGGQAVERASAGQRTAVNLAGIEHTAVTRGMTLAAPGKFRVTRRIDACITLLPSAPKLKQRSRVRFFLGTAETIAEIYLYGRSELAGGASGYAQLRLEDAALNLRGDRFILRQLSPVITVGGGVVLDPQAQRARPREEGRERFLKILERGTQDEMLAAMVERASVSMGGMGYLEITARTGWLEDEVANVAKSIVARGEARLVATDPPWLVATGVFTEAREKIAAKVEMFQRENPLQPGILREDLRVSLGRRVRAETFRAALAELVAGRKLELHGDVVRLPGAGITLQPEEDEAKKEIAAVFLQAGLTVPGANEVLANLKVETKRAEKLLHILLGEKTLVRVSADLIFHSQALAHLKTQLETYRKVKGERITVPAFKELTGITRKYAIPLLEYLDRARVTRRQGDERVIL